MTQIYEHYPGSLACRLSYLKSTIERWKTDYSHKNFLEGITSSFFQLFQFCYDFLIPSMFFIFFVSAHSQAEDIVAGKAIIEDAYEYLIFAFFISCILELVCCFKSTPKKLSVTILYMSVIFQTIVLLLILPSFLTNLAGTLLIVCLATCYLIFTLIRSNGVANSKKKILSIAAYTLLRPAIGMLIWTYTFANLHDRAWGTKGHDAATSISTRQEKNFKRYRTLCMSMWFLSNAATFYFFIFVFTWSLMTPSSIVLLAVFSKEILSPTLFKVLSSGSIRSRLKHQASQEK